MIPAHYDVALIDYGPLLLTRAAGSDIREVIESELERREGYVDVVLDFSGVVTIDASCTSELIGRLLNRMAPEHPGKALLLRALEGSAADNVQLVLEHMRAIAVRQTGRTLELVGAPTPEDIETFALVRDRGPITVAGLAATLGLAAPAMNNRLSRLLAFAAIRRHPVPGRGQTFVYAAPLAPIPDGRRGVE